MRRDETGVLSRSAAAASSFSRFYFATTILENVLSRPAVSLTR